jgi:hypothetical protein
MTVPTIFDERESKADQTTYEILVIEELYPASGRYCFDSSQVSLVGVACHFQNSAGSIVMTGPYLADMNTNGVEA